MESADYAEVANLTIKFCWEIEIRIIRNEIVGKKKENARAKNYIVLVLNNNKCQVIIDKLIGSSNINR